MQLATTIKNALFNAIVMIAVILLFGLGLYHAERLHSQPVEYRDYCAWAVTVGATDTQEYKRVCEKVTI